MTDAILEQYHQPVTNLDLEAGINPLAYYAQHSIITNPAEHTDILTDLPTNIPGLVRVVHGLLIHPFCVELYQVQLSPIQREEIHLRTVAQMLARIRELDPTPLTISREPAQRLVGNCRDHAVLFTALLRQQGIPARMRVGFARYFPSNKNEDHWITEYWDAAQSRWVLVDPQLDETQREAFNIDFDPLDMRFYDHFYTGGQAWQRCRSGQDKSYNFGFKKWKGWGYIRGGLLHDLDALNKTELTPFDWWGEFITKNERLLTLEDKVLLDDLAELTADVDTRFNEMCAAYKDLPYSQIVRSKLRLLGLTDDARLADPHQLRPAAASNRLADFQAIQPEALPEYVPFQLPDHLADPPATALAGDPFGLGDIIIRGARQHNLQNIDVSIPRFKFVVVTGVSGSGKSSLAFDTLYADGQRRYVESLSAYARQFLGQMEKPEVDQIIGLSPAIAIEQKTVSKNPRSTVGTVTEVFDYLRVLFARAGIPHCPQCGRGVQPQTTLQIAQQLTALTPGTRFQLLAPIVRRRKGTHADLLAQARHDGYTRARIDGEVVDLLASQTIPSLKKTKPHNIDLIVDRLIVPNCDLEAQAEFRTRLIDSVETTLKAGKGLLTVDLGHGEEVLLSEHNACPHCDISFSELTPQLFSFNSPLGMCPDCNGLGTKFEFNPDMFVNPDQSLHQGGVRPWGELQKKRSSGTYKAARQIVEQFDHDLDTRWRDLSEECQQAILYGGAKVVWEWDNAHGQGRHEGRHEGVVTATRRRYRQTKSEGMRKWYSQFMSQQICPTCQGERLCPEARFVTVGDKRLPEVTAMTIAQAHQWATDLPQQLDVEQLEIAHEVLKEICERLQFMLNVGLHYLTLDRSAPSLSGGEGQRIRLASQLGCGLVGVLYVLDEPSIGLHARDHHALLDTLCRLRDTGNTVLVIEHDEDTMRTADWLIDLGPGAGVLGGDMVAAGTPEEVMANPDSLTGRYLSGELQVMPPNGKHRRESQGWLSVVGARLHNLKEIEARFPLGVMTCVTGVSGSGKSSLISQTLHPALSRALHKAQRIPGPHDRIEGLEQIDKVINITQSPIGRTPRSNPGTYVNVFTEIRKVFANTPEAKARGYKPGRFSFNVKGGYCEACQGYGQKRVEMHFLADVWVTCKECGGKRFNRQTLEIKYRDKSIADVLEMDVQEALAFFANHPKIMRILQTLHDVGLDYIKLGQSALTLSGGEAQRVKLAKELSRVSTGDTLYILDEPTTGLHFADIQKLLDVLHRLTDAGNTVIIIEHNLDVIKTVDWIIDLGPEGGDEGGYIVAQGTPEEVAQVTESYTGQFLKEWLAKSNRVK
jgi:excinuclease ABC subunit A